MVNVNKYMQYNNYIDPMGDVADVGVSKNRGTPKWMVKIMENPVQMDDLPPLFLETPM